MKARAWWGEKRRGLANCGEKRAPRWCFDPITRAKKEEKESNAAVRKKEEKKKKFSRTNKVS